MNTKLRVRTLLLEHDLASYEEWLKQTSRGPLTVSPIKGNLIITPNPDMATADFSRYSNVLSDNKVYNRLLNNVQPNECFTNSALVMDYISRTLSGVKVIYVLGLIKEGGNMFGHAWNKIGSKYYDFTLDDPESRQYFGVVEFSNINEVTSLPMFDPDMKCAEALNVNGESYDKNGMCSVYQYYKQIGY